MEKRMPTRLAALLVIVLALGACSGGGTASTSVTSTDVVSAFVAAGLDAESPTAMTVADFGAAPKLTEDGTRFLIPSLGEGSGGRAMVFTSVDDLRKTKEYYDALGESSAMFFSWTFANEPVHVLVQINGELPEAEATKYGQVVADLK